MSFLDTIFARLVAELVDGRAPILTPLARLLTSADEKDARIAVRLLTDQQLADALAERKPAAHDPWTRALVEEALRRGK